MTGLRGKKEPFGGALWTLHLVPGPRENAGRGAGPHVETPSPLPSTARPAPPHSLLWEGWPGFRTTEFRGVGVGCP